MTKREEIKITICPFRGFADYDACADLQREAWGFEDIDIVSSPTLIVMDRYGGILLGAYNSIGEMIGFVCSMLGREGDEIVQYSHMLAVRTAYRNFNIGYRLKLAQRKESLKRGIAAISWTFDPMQPLNAYFNFGKLGARSHTYEENFYGATTSVLHRGFPTDRFVVRWDLESPKVRTRLEEGPPRHDLRKELSKYTRINALAEVESGLASCSSMKLGCAAHELLFEVPYNLPEIKSKNPALALEWLAKMRQVFRGYFKNGYEVTDFWVGEDAARTRAFYYLEKSKKA